MSTCDSWTLRWSQHPHLIGPLAAARLGCPSGDDLQVPGTPRGCCWGTLLRSFHPCHPTNPAFQPPSLLPRPPRFRCSTVQRCPAQDPEWWTGPRCYLCSLGSAIQSSNAQLLHFPRLQLWIHLLPLLLHCCLLFHLHYRWLPLQMLWAQSLQSLPWFHYFLLLLPGNVQCSEPRLLHSQTLPRWWCCPEHTW